MQPILSLTMTSSPSEPNLEVLRAQGWQIGSVNGAYCVAWKGSAEVLLVWRGSGWYRLSGKDDI